MLKDRQEICKSKTDVSAQGTALCCWSCSGTGHSDCSEAGSQLSALDFLAGKFQLVLRSSSHLSEEFG